MELDRCRRRRLGTCALVALALVLASAAAQPVPAAKDEAAPAPPPKPADAEPKPWKPPKFSARQAERDAMVRAIKGYGLTDKAVLAAMAAVPRHEFVPSEWLTGAYRDTPLPIGHGQTISQPYMVAEMTRQLRLKPGDKVLEIGTGSGYQVAVLAHFTANVYTMEIVRPLAVAAEKRLERLGYDVVAVRHGDGYDGWAEKGPFDAIIVTCVAGQVPPPLLAQLKPGGRMVIPVGGRFALQWLMLVEKDKAGKVRSRSLMAVRFVPLLREDPTSK